MHKGNVTTGAGPKSWGKCRICGKILKGDRKRQQHTKEKHS